MRAEDYYFDISYDSDGVWVIIQPKSTLDPFDGHYAGSIDAILPEWLRDEVAESVFVVNDPEHTAKTVKADLIARGFEYSSLDGDE